jgi:hypothetical protein
MLLLTLVVLGLAAQWLDWREWPQALQWARSHAQQGWLVAALILLQVVRSCSPCPVPACYGW